MASESRSASKDVKRAVSRSKKGTLKSRKQAIAIGLSEARKKGKKVPSRKSAGKSKTSGKASSKMKRTSKK